MVKKRLVLGCGALAHDMIALVRHNDALKNVIDIRCLPAKLHNTPQLIAREVDAYLQQHAHHYRDIFIAYGDCGTAGELDKVLARYDAQRLPGAHCYEFFMGQEAFEALIEEELGSFFLTDYLVRNFNRLVIEGLGLDRHPELFDAYFKHYKKLVYIAQTESPELKAQAAEYAENFNWGFEYRLVGIGGLQPIAGSSFNIEVRHG